MIVLLTTTIVVAQSTVRRTVLPKETSEVVEGSEKGDLSFKSGTWSYNYYIGNQQVPFDTFMNELNAGNITAGNMFNSGKNLSVAGTVIGSIGAFCLGYDLGGRLAGGEGNSALLVSGGGVMITGIALYYVGKGKMGKALIPSISSKRFITSNPIWE